MTTKMKALSGFRKLGRDRRAISADDGIGVVPKPNSTLMICSNNHQSCFCRTSYSLFSEPRKDFRSSSSAFVRSIFCNSERPAKAFGAWL